MKWLELFKFTFDEVELFWLTPWFLLVIADGAKSQFDSLIWWGFELNYSRVPYEEGGLIFIRCIKTVFRTYSLMQLLQNSQLFSAYKNGLL